MSSEDAANTAPASLPGDAAGWAAWLAAQIGAAAADPGETVIRVPTGARKERGERALARMAPGCTRITFEVDPAMGAPADWADRKGARVPAHPELARKILRRH